MAEADSPQKSEASRFRFKSELYIAPSASLPSRGGCLDSKDYVGRESAGGDDFVRVYAEGVSRFDPHWRYASRLAREEHYKTPVVVLGEEVLQGEGEPGKDSPWKVRIAKDDDYYFLQVGADGKTSGDFDASKSITLIEDEIGVLSIIKMGEEVACGKDSSDTDGIDRMRLFKAGSYFIQIGLRYKDKPDEFKAQRSLSLSESEMNAAKKILGTIDIKTSQDK